ncbi:MAG: response regulator transcription factor [Mycobacteriaceae bacterium]|nr:response regulator transcription factor [Mycobacteriaceae bacterium]
MRILLIEDDDGLANALVEALTARLYRIRRKTHGADLLTSHRECDVVILDLGLPDGDGLDVLRQLRTISSVPVVVLTARGDERTVVRGLRSGADDYVVKPPRVAELAARLETVVRRRATAAQPPAAQVESGDVRIDLAARHVDVGGVRVALTHKEFELLRVLAEHAGSAVSRQQLMDEIWGNAFVAVSRSLDVHMTGLRTKLNRPKLITTIRGYGYRWEPEAGG